MHKDLRDKTSMNTQFIEELSNENDSKGMITDDIINLILLSN